MARPIEGEPQATQPVDPAPPRNVRDFLTLWTSHLVDEIWVDVRKKTRLTDRSSYSLISNAAERAKAKWSDVVDRIGNTRIPALTQEPSEGEAQTKEVEVQFKVDPEGLRDMRRLEQTLGTPNLATGLYNAVTLMNRLYDYQADGWQLTLTKGEDSRRFRLPTKEDPPTQPEVQAPSP